MGKLMRPGEVMYLLLVLRFMFGKTYFCRLEDCFGLKPAFLAVFKRVFLAKPLRELKIIFDLNSHGIF